MNINLKIVLIPFFAFLISSFSFAQKDFQGKVYYESKTTGDMSSFSRADMSEERKKQMEDRMRSALEKTYVLTFNQVASIYKEDKEEETTQGGGRGARFRAMMSSFSIGYQYKNIREKLLLQDQEFFGKQFLIKDELVELEWKMTGETKKIGDYTCFKATALKTSADVDVTSLRPSSTDSDNDDEKEPEQIEVVAWYTMQIPISQGPQEYWGLPGLILEVQTDKTTIRCSKIIINSEEKEEINAPSKGKKVTKKQYDKIVARKVEEMNANFRARGGGQGRNRG